MPASGAKTPQATATLAPAAAALRAAEARARSASTMAEKMGDHSYDYDLVVIGGGSGGLVRSTFSPSGASRSHRLLVFF